MYIYNIFIVLYQLAFTTSRDSRNIEDPLLLPFLQDPHPVGGPRWNPPKGKCDREWPSATPKVQSGNRFFTSKIAEIYGCSSPRNMVLIHSHIKCQTRFDLDTHFRTIEVTYWLMLLSMKHLHLAQTNISDQFPEG